MNNIMISLFTLFTICVVHAAHAADYKSTFMKLINEKNFNDMAPMLAEWEKASPKDPEMFIAYYNYYLFRDYHEFMTFEPPEDKNSVGMMVPREQFNIKDVRKGLAYLDRGLALHPRRLDMHIGKIHALGQIKDYRGQRDQILSVIKLIPEHKGKWLWRDGKPEANFDDNFQSDVQERISNFMRQKPEVRKYTKEIAELMIKHFPKNVWWYNDIGHYYFQVKDYKSAVNYFLSGEKIDPRDEIILNNIAYTYELSGDKENAILYYKKLTRSKNPEIKKRAEEKVVKLSK